MSSKFGWCLSNEHAPICPGSTVTDGVECQCECHVSTGAQVAQPEANVDHTEMTTDNVTLF